MPDDQLTTDYSNSKENTLDTLADKVRTSSANPGAADKTLLRVERYLNAFLEFSGQYAEEIQNPVVRDEIVSMFMERLQVSDPVIEKASKTYLDNLAAQKAVVSCEPTQQERHQEADPVDMAIGQFVHEVEDISVNGAGIDFVFRRIYKNQAKYWGPLGAKWDHSYNLWIREVGTNLLRSTGQLREDAYTKHPKFGQGGFNYWVPPDGVHGVIEEQNNSYAWRSPDGTKCFYTPDPSNPLIHLAERVEDRFGNFLAMQYDAEETGRLISIIINHPKRIISFNYDTMGRIESITDYAHRAWYYTYDDFGDLVAFTLPATDQNPEGSTSYYEYSSSMQSENLWHNLIRIIDPVGRVYVENEYGTDVGLLRYNKVVRQRLGAGESYFEYEQVVNEFDSPYSDSEEPAWQVNFVERNGQPIHYVYNKFGNLLLKEQYIFESGSLRLLQWRYRYNRDGALIGILSPEGSVTQYYYGRDHYLQVHGITDEEVPIHNGLTMQERLQFGNRLSMVRKGKTFSFEAMVRRGVWSDFFPDILANDQSDIITKYTYEPDYQQLQTMSDPRFTQSADPGFAESRQYGDALTRYEYSRTTGDPTNRFLVRVRYPNLIQADGTIQAGATEEYIKYDTRGRILKQADRSGFITETTYYGRGDGIKEGYLWKKVVDPAGLAVTAVFEVNDVGMVTAIHHPRSVGAAPGRFVTHFNVNEQNQIVQTRVSEPFSYLIEARYDPSGLVERIERDIRDELGMPILGGKEVHLSRYNLQKQLERESIGGKNKSSHYKTNHRYDDTDRLVATFTPAGGVVRRRYNTRMLQRATVRGAGSPSAATIQAEFDGDDRSKCAISGRGFRTKAEYDQFGRVIVIEDAMRNQKRLSYDKAGNVTIERFFEQKDDGSFVLLSRSEYKYDELNRRTYVGNNLFQDPLPVANIKTDYMASPGPGVLIATKYFYDPKGRLVRIINAKGQNTTFEYDALDRKKAETDQLNNRSETQYDANGNVTRRDIFESIIDPVTGRETGKELFSTSYDYDELDRMTTVTDSIGNITKHAYDSRNNIVRTTDSLGNVTRYEYDVYNRKEREIRELTDTGVGSGVLARTVITKLEYDENGNPIAYIDGNGNRIEQSYDKLDRRTSVKYLDGSMYLTQYDEDDNIIVIQDNNGLIRNFKYDSLGRMFRMDVDSSGHAPGLMVEGERLEKYTYDALGRSLSEENGFATVQKKVDSLGRVFNENITFTSPVLAGGPRTLQREYDELGVIHKLTYPNNRVVQYDCDSLNRLTKITNLTKGAGYPGSGTFPDKYDLLDVTYRGKRPSLFIFGNGASAGYKYDGAGRVIQIEHRGTGGALLLRTQQLYDGIGNMRFRNEIDPGGASAERFEYDSVYRLTRMKPDVIPAFNPATILPTTPPPVQPIPNQQAIIDALIGPLAQTAANATFTYDPAANRIQEQKLGQPVINYSTNTLNEYQQIGAAAFTYDLNGSLTMDGNRQYFYDARNLLVRVYDPVANADIVRFYHDCRGRRIAENRGGNITHLLLDGLNIVEEYVNGGLNVQYVHEAQKDRICEIVRDGHEYWLHKDLVGSTRILTDEAGVSSGQHSFDPFGILRADSALFNRVCFAGRRYDREINMYDFRAREYFMIMGRFLQRDSKLIGTGNNSYEYVWDNPFRFTDPMGTEPKEFVKPRDNVDTGTSNNSRLEGDDNKIDSGTSGIVHKSNKACYADSHYIKEFFDGVLISSFPRPVEGIIPHLRKRPNHGEMSEMEFKLAYGLEESLGVHGLGAEVAIAFVPDLYLQASGKFLVFNFEIKGGFTSSHEGFFESRFDSAKKGPIVGTLAGAGTHTVWVNGEKKVDEKYEPLFSIGVAEILGLGLDARLVSPFNSVMNRGGAPSLEIEYQLLMLHGTYTKQLW